MWPGGAPTPDPTINPVAKLANTNLKNIRNKLDSIKSKTVKTL
jgi:hypothetical protein